ncbi:hypothetical protein BJY00DRAFT_320129 [Aspergillus carlsbadensis]|nr:hypothetical protein BJY00DRAFT_320129 [Aspergillus carlsbadensis]
MGLSWKSSPPPPSSLAWVPSCREQIERALNSLELPTQSWKKKALVRVRQALRSEALRQYMAQLHRFCEQVNQDVVITSHSINIETNHLLRQVSSVQMDTRQRTILNWLTPHVHSLRHRDLLAQCYPGTVRWIFDQDQFLDWQSEFHAAGESDASAEGEGADSPGPGPGRGDPTPRVIWYDGGPGIGKSVIM